jgi:hypothetical protein
VANVQLIREFPKPPLLVFFTNSIQYALKTYFFAFAGVQEPLVEKIPSQQRLPT